MSQLHQDNVASVQRFFDGQAPAKTVATNGAAFAFANAVKSLEFIDPIWGNDSPTRNFNSALYGTLRTYMLEFSRAWVSTWGNFAVRLLANMKALGLTADPVYGAVLDRCIQACDINNELAGGEYLLLGQRYVDGLTDGALLRLNLPACPYPSIGLPFVAVPTTDSQRINCRKNVWENWNIIKYSKHANPLETSQLFAGKLYVLAQCMSALDEARRVDPNNAPMIQWFQKQWDDMHDHFEPLLAIDENTVPRP